MVEKWMDRFDLANEILPTRSIVEIVDDERVLIEHHSGVCAYGRNMIRIKASFGSICISGKNLQIRHMTKDKLIIKGCIYSVMLEKVVKEC